MASLPDRYLAALHALAQTGSSRDQPIPTRPATADELDTLRKLGMRDPVLSLYARATLAETADVALRVHCPDSIATEHNDLCPGSEIGPLGFVVIGSSHCGDVFALDYTSPPGPDGTPRVLLVSHELEYTSVEDVLSDPTVVAPTFIDFLEGAASHRYDF